MIVVVPTCRGVHLDHLQPLIDHGCRFIVVDDTPGSIRVDHPQFEVYSRSDRLRLLGEHEIAIPTGNGACRDLGFYIAWKEADEDEIIVALDDDCVVESEEFVRDVRSIFGDETRPTASGAGGHFNIFDLYDDPAIRVQFPRGFPYSARFGYRPWSTRDGARKRVEMNLGLWKGVLDINGIDRLSATRHEYPDATLRIRSVAIPPHALISVCSGNMQFRRSVIPAIYQLPMNVEIGSGWKINRYGDIWGGFILKKLMDRRGDCLSVGAPLVRHTTVGPAVSNVQHEHLAHLVNEEFIDLLGRATEDIAPSGYLDMMGELAEHLLRLGPRATPILRIYLDHLSRSLQAWIAALGPAAS